MELDETFLWWVRTNYESSAWSQVVRQEIQLGERCIEICLDEKMRRWRQGQREEEETKQDVKKASEMLVAPRISEYFLKFMNSKIQKIENFENFENFWNI